MRGEGTAARGAGPLRPYTHGAPARRGVTFPRVVAAEWVKDATFSAALIFILIVGLVFYFVPNAKVRFRDVWLGAILTGLLWRGALTGFSLYVRDMSRFDSIHGTVAGVVVFLLWVYVSAVILLFGVEVTAAYARLRRRRPDEIPAAPSPRL